MPQGYDLAYLITVGRSHLLPAEMLLLTLREKTAAPIVAVGKVDRAGAARLRDLGATYIDERDIDLRGPRAFAAGPHRGEARHTCHTLVRHALGQRTETGAGQTRRDSEPRLWPLAACFSGACVR